MGLERRMLDPLRGKCSLVGDGGHGERGASVKDPFGNGGTASLVSNIAATGRAISSAKRS